MFVKGISRQVQSGGAGNGWYYLRIPQYAYGVYNIVWSSKITATGTAGTNGASIVATLSFCSDASVNNFTYTNTSAPVPDGSASYYSPLYQYDASWNVGDSITVNGTLFYNSTSSLRNIFATIALPTSTTGPYLTINDVYNSYISVTKVG
jgi:hypothetical protein